MLEKALKCFEKVQNNSENENIEFLCKTIGSYYVNRAKTLEKDITAQISIYKKALEHFEKIPSPSNKIVGSMDYALNKLGAAYWTHANALKKDGFNDIEALRNALSCYKKVTGDFQEIAYVNKQIQTLEKILTRSQREIQNDCKNRERRDDFHHGDRNSSHRHHRHEGSDRDRERSREKKPNMERKHTLEKRDYHDDRRNYFFRRH